MSHWVNYDPSVYWHTRFNAHRKAEDQEQIKVVNWARSLTTPWLQGAKAIFHVPNGGGRSKVEAGILKAMGVTPGVSDLLLLAPAWQTNHQKELHGLVIEMKCVRIRAHAMQAGRSQVQAGEVSNEQKDWLRSRIANGYAACVCWWAEDAQDVIVSYLQGTWRQPKPDELWTRYKEFS